MSTKFNANYVTNYKESKDKIFTHAVQDLQNILNDSLDDPHFVFDNEKDKEGKLIQMDNLLDKLMNDEQYSSQNFFEAMSFICKYN
jgi:hypothetical protein